MLKIKYEKSKEKKCFTNNFHNINIFYYILIFLSCIKICRLIQNLQDPKSINLINGNIFIIHTKGIDIYDSSLEKKIKNVFNFTLGDSISPEILQNIVISRFSPEEYGHIICIINHLIYIFDYEGNHLYKDTKNISVIDKIHYELLPIKNNNEDLIFMVGYINISDYINITFFNYKIINKQLNISRDIAPFKYKYNGTEKEINDDKLFSCQIMTKSNQKELIVCFIPLKQTQYPSITQFFIDLDSYEINLNESLV